MGSFRNTRIFGTLVLLAICTGLSGCATRHWAQVEETKLPPPPGEKVLHTDRIVIHVTDEAEETQCVAYDRFHPVCFYNIRSALESGLVRGLWPSYPEVIVGTPKDAGPSDYLLQVEVTLDALPPDDAGPGWSAGARSRFRVLREGKVIAEETLASRSRAQFPYGTPLGEGATEVIDATVLHVAQAVSQVPETRPDEPKPLPRVASRTMDPQKDKSAAPSEQPAAPAPSELAKSAANTKAAPDSPTAAESSPAVEAPEENASTPAPPTAESSDSE